MQGGYKGVVDGGNGKKARRVHSKHDGGNTREDNAPKRPGEYARQERGKNTQKKEKFHKCLWHRTSVGGTVDPAGD